MLRFAANLSMMYTEHPFLERFGAAATDGFAGVEYMGPYDYPAETIASLLRRHRLEQVLFNTPPGDWEAGMRGMACLPGWQGEFRAGVRQALEYAGALGCARVHVMSGIAPAGADPLELREVYLGNLLWAAEMAGAVGVRLLLEAINGRDMPGYYLQRQEVAHGFVEEVGSRALGVQMDLYHCQISEGDLAMKVRRYLGVAGGERVGHVQVAGVPDRGEPDVGEVEFGYLLRLLEELGYAGWVGCEYRPRAGTSAGLGWLQRLRAEGLAG